MGNSAGGTPGGNKGRKKANPKQPCGSAAPERGSPIPDWEGNPNAIQSILNYLPAQIAHMCRYGWLNEAWGGVVHLFV